MYLGVRIVVALILLPLYLRCFKIYFIRCENCNSCFLFIHLFLLSIWLVNLFPSLWVFVYPCMWNGSGCSILLGFGCIFWLGDLVDLNLGLLSFDVNWLFYPLVDVNSSLCWCSLLFGIFLERLILVVSFCV